MSSLEELTYTPEEIIRSTVTEVREMNWENPQEVETYLQFLTDPVNCQHFTGLPATVEDFQIACAKPGVHPLVAENMRGEIVGGMIIRDAEPQQNDHFIERVVVDSGFQDRGVGRQMLARGIDWAFANPAWDGRERIKLDIAVIMNVAGWERMQHLVESLGFGNFWTLIEQVDFTEEGQIVERKKVIRSELLRSRWNELRQTNFMITPAGTTVPYNA